MNKKLLQTLNRTLESVKTTHYALVTIEALQARLTEELDCMDADPGRECLIILLHELTAKMRSASIVVSPGYSFLPDSYLLFLTGVTRVNPVEWDLPFSHFTKSVHDGAEISFEAGTGCLEVARKVLSGRENEMIIETELGLFEITFLDGIELANVKLRIITSAELDRFSLTIKRAGIRWTRRLSDFLVAEPRTGPSSLNPTRCASGSSTSTLNQCPTWSC